MSGPLILRQVLSNSVILTEHVDPDDIVCGVLSEGSGRPAITIHEIACERFQPVADTATQIHSELCQVTVYARSYSEQQVIKKLVKSKKVVAMNNRNLIAGVKCDSILHTTDGPYMYDVDDDEHIVTIDYMVKYLEE